MDTTANAAARSERLPDLMGYAMTVAFVLLGVDLRAFAWGGQWLCNKGLRAVFAVRI
jgi:hypothetical protein